jgi:peptidoglycan/LPS O-acetylase OafA/YrhL
MTWDKNPPSLPSYKPYIDGLRAIAVLAVVAFHVFPNFVPGGFIGVDIFFVISGYLITKIILLSLVSEKFSFLNFFIHRIRRIFPALLLVLLFSILFGWIVLLSDEYMLLAKHIMAASTFASNFIYLGEIGYFDISAHKKVLLNLWSLAIEAQFYIAWPIILWLSWKKKINLLIVSLLLLILSFAFNIIKVRIDPTYVFYSPLTRAWELMAGCLLACTQLYNIGSIRLRYPLFRKLISFFREKASLLPNIFSSLGIFLFACGFYKINQASEFPGWWALIPVIGAFMILASGSSAIINRYLLSNKFLVWIGLISYPLYLWHWPLLVFTNVIEEGEINYKFRLALIFLSIVLAWATYRFIEVPIRANVLSKKLIAVLLIAVMFFFGVIGVVIFYKKGISSRVEKFENISKAAGEWAYPGRLTSFEFKGRTFRQQLSNKNEITLFVGDSNIEQYYPRVDKLISSEPNRVNSAVFITGGGCLPIPLSPYGQDHKKCSNLMEDALSYSLENKNVKNVVIGAQWNGYLSGGFGLNGTFEFGTKDYMESLLRLSSYIKQLKNAGKKVYLILNIPTGIELDPKYMVSRGISNFPFFLKIRDGGIERSFLDSSYGNIQVNLLRLADQSGAIVISPMHYLCNTVFCPSIDEAGRPIYKDNTHLRPSYVRDSVFYIDETLIK